MNQPLLMLLLVGLPYAAIAAFIAGAIWRYKTRFTISSLSSQFLESRALVFGSIPFHLGIVLIVAGHLAPLIVPGPWQRFVSNRTVLLTVETIGMAAAILALAGLLALLVRRAGSTAVRESSTAVDVIVLIVLIAQVSLGLGVASLHRWGAVWSVATTTPYLWSIFTLRPDAALATGLPPLAMAHLTGAWIVLALVPFTRLVHMFSFPFRYLSRPPQKVVWARSRRVTGEPAVPAADEQTPAPPLGVGAQPAER